MKIVDAHNAGLEGSRSRSQALGVQRSCPDPGTGAASYRSRGDHATKLERDLKFEVGARTQPRGFWAGDGGVFVASLDESGHPTNLCAAADAVFEQFKIWRKEKSLEIRVTATKMELSVGSDVGDWCSPQFNQFLKYEREMGLPNAFVITQELRAALIINDEIARFEKKRQVILPNGASLTSCIDSKHVAAFNESPLSFERWLSGQIKAERIPHSGYAERSLFRVGRCTVLDAAKQIDGYGEIVLEPQERIETASRIDDEDLETWKTKYQELADRKVAGTSLKVNRFITELFNDPHPRLDYRTIKYSEARAFSMMLAEDPAMARRYRDRALDVIGKGTTNPNVLSTAIVIIVGDDNSPELIIANRRRRAGGYDANCWSVSIGEQFAPVSGPRGSREVPVDSSIVASINRGMKEELLGDGYTGRMRVSVVAFCLEDDINDYIFVALADLRPLKFRDLAECWRGAIDMAEHDAMAALPLTEKALRLCIGTDRLPEDLWTEMKAQELIALAPGIGGLSEDSHRWQPNSHIRLVAALWYVGHRTERNRDMAT